MILTSRTLPFALDLVHKPTTPKDPLPSSSLHYLNQRHEQQICEPSYLPFTILILICLHSWPGESELSAVRVKPLFLAPLGRSNLLLPFIPSPTGSFIDVAQFLDHRDLQPIVTSHYRK